MIREVIKTDNNVYMLNLPDEMVGKTIEVIAFEIENAKDDVNNGATIQDISERYSRYPLISHSEYKFSRDEANDYE